MTCPVCHNLAATTHPTLGVMPCNECQLRRQTQTEPASVQPEFTTADIKEQRKEHGKSILQPWRSGVASQEFADAYPEKAKELFKGKKPQKVWQETPGYNNLKYGK